MRKIRSLSKYPGLEKKYNLKIRQDLLDQDYIDKLSSKEKKWLSDFNEEYVSASFKHKKKLHKTKALRRDCYNKNNARNRDIFSITKANELLSFDTNGNNTNSENTEDVIIEILDKSKQKF